MPVYIVWEIRHLDPLGRSSLTESRGTRLEADSIVACAEQVRREKAVVRHDVKEFLIVERGHRILPGGGPLNFHGAEYIASDRE